MIFLVAGLAVPGCEGPSSVVKSPTYAVLSRNQLCRELRARWGEGSRKVTNDDEGEGGGHNTPQKWWRHLWTAPNIFEIFDHRTFEVNVLICCEYFSIFGIHLGICNASKFAWQLSWGGSQGFCVQSGHSTCLQKFKGCVNVFAPFQVIVWTWDVSGFNIHDKVIFEGKSF